MKVLSTEKAFEEEMKKGDFRVAIFGSARVKEKEEQYVLVRKLAKMIGEAEMDIVTGGGPGLMEAANRGHKEGVKTKKQNPPDSLGLLIKLPEEQDTNNYVQIKKEFQKFINRLETFLKLSHAVVVAEGGIGTLLEMVYTLQVIQVKKNRSIPIILMGDMWIDLVRWMQKWQLKEKYIKKEDFDSIYVVKNEKEAMEIIAGAKIKYLDKEKNLCPDLKKYKIKFKRSTRKLLR